MRRVVFGLMAGLIISVLTCRDVSAQATAQISGTARDQSGAVLPGVEITVTQTETGITRSTLTNETGLYVLPNLAVGSYRFEAGLPGFRTYVQTGIVLQVNSSAVINPLLEVGQVTEQVEVQANAALVETRSQGVGQVIENQRILELPLDGRQVTDLITLAGGAVYVSDGRASTIVGGPSPQLAIAGAAGYGVDFTLDGASHVSFMTGSTQIMPFPDATQELKVETSGVSAQRGNSTAVAAVTKAGTNELHGDLFEFVRNDLFNARSYFATTHSTLKRNQFGGTVGGPIVKNKLFFFGGYQGATLRQDPADIRTFVPTPAMMAGDWTAFTSPACNAGRQIALRAPFVNNRIDSALYSKPSLFLVNYRGKTPFPTTNNPCGEITYGNRTASNEEIYVGKVDYQASAAHALFGRALIRKGDIPNPEKFNTILLQDTGWSSSMQQSYTLGSTYLLGANTVQAFRLAINRVTNNFYNVKPGQLFNWCEAGVKAYCAPEVTRINNLAITGGFGFGSGFLTGQKYAGTSYGINDDVSVVRGAHQISAGVSALHGRMIKHSSFVTGHNFAFNGSATSLGMADFMLGRPSQFTTGNSNAHYANATTFATYATDSWKAASRLTLNYGVRWEPSIPQNVEATSNFNSDRFRQGIKTTVYLNAPAGLYFRGDPGFPKNGINARWLQLAPRVGLAWDVSGDGRTSVRASYALGYIQIPGEYHDGHSADPPWGGRVVLQSPAGGLEDPWRDVPGGNIFPYSLDKNAPFPPFGQRYSQRYDQKTPYSQSWNISVQRQIGTGWLASASYLGSNMVHVYTNRMINPATYFPAATCTLNGVTYNPCSSTNNTEARRRFSLERPVDGAKIGTAAETDDGGTQSYQGTLLSIERRAARGVTLTGNYTWSHCIGLSSAGLYLPVGPQSSMTTYIDNRALDRGNCESDRRHIFNMTAVAETPQFSNATLRILATGWRLAGIYRRSAGSPLDILAGSDRALTAVTNQTANQVLENPYGDKSAGPSSRYLNPAAFALPDIGTYGRVGHYSVQGPGTWSFDVSISRVFPFGERQRVEARAEAYNLTNSFRPGNPSSTVNNANFGVIRTSLDPRILQFALKYVF